jgi:transcriptional regulator with XRE-family HTH domain
MTKETLGAKMRSARLLAKKTQDQVADHLDITKGAVSQWENDLTVPELEYFRGYCLFVGGSADEILLEHGMDPLLRQLVGIWDKLSPDARDSLLGNANRLLVEEKPESGPHNPYGEQPPKRNSAKNQPKVAKRLR